jgi:transcriptional regulator with XRE-family HTH domain
MDYPTRARNSDMESRYRSGQTLAQIAAQEGISRGYLSLIISGKRKASVTHVLRAVTATGSLVPIQWICKQVGGALDWDEQESREQQLERELAQLRSSKGIEARQQRRRVA